MMGSCDQCGKKEKLYQVGDAKLCKECMTSAAKEFVYKAGNSRGAKLGWQSRLRGIKQKIGQEMQPRSATRGFLAGAVLGAGSVYGAKKLGQSEREYAKYRNDILNGNFQNKNDGIKSTLLGAGASLLTVPMASVIMGAPKRQFKIGKDGRRKLVIKAPGKGQKKLIASTLAGAALGAGTAGFGKAAIRAAGSAYRARRTTIRGTPEFNKDQKDKWRTIWGAKNFEEFMNRYHYKAGNSAGAKKGWQSRLHGFISSQKRPGSELRNFAGGAVAGAGIGIANQVQNHVIASHLTKLILGKKPDSKRGFAAKVLGIPGAIALTGTAVGGKIMGRPKSMSHPGRKFGAAAAGLASGMYLGHHAGVAARKVAYAREFGNRNMGVGKEMFTSISEKAGTSQGAKLGWQSRLRGITRSGSRAMAGAGGIVAGLAKSYGQERMNRAAREPGDATRIMVGLQPKSRQAQWDYNIGKGLTQLGDLAGSAVRGKAPRRGNKKWTKRRQTRVYNKGKRAGEVVGQFLAKRKEETMSISEKAGNSAGAKKGWQARLHGMVGEFKPRSGGVLGFAHRNRDNARSLLGGAAEGIGIAEGARRIIKGDVLKGMAITSAGNVAGGFLAGGRHQRVGKMVNAGRVLGGFGYALGRSYVHNRKQGASAANQFNDMLRNRHNRNKESDMNTTYKAGTSAGAKLGWQSRLRGGVSRAAGAISSGARKAGSAYVGAVKKVGGAYLNAGRGAVGHAKKVGRSLDRAGNKLRQPGKGVADAAGVFAGRMVRTGARLAGRGALAFGKHAVRTATLPARVAFHVAKHSVLNAGRAARGLAYGLSGKEAMGSVTYKYGTSSGAKLGWQSRGRGVGSAVRHAAGAYVGAVKKVAGAYGRVGRAYSEGFKKSLPGKAVGAYIKGGKAIQRGVIGGAKKAGSAYVGAVKKVGGAYARTGKKLAGAYMRGARKAPIGAVARAVGRHAGRARQFYSGVAQGIAGKSDATFNVFKDANDQYRWVAISSTAFLDKDKQIVSRKAMEADVELSGMGQKDYGPLRWWHVGVPDGPGLDLGRCDFRMTQGRTLIESGTFHDPDIALAAKELAPQLSMSIGFRHSAAEPDAEGVFHNIRTFERSLLPSSKASNLLTAFSVR